MDNHDIETSYLIPSEDPGPGVEDRIIERNEFELVIRDLREPQKLGRRAVIERMVTLAQSWTQRFGKESAGELILAIEDSVRRLPRMNCSSQIFQGQSFTCLYKALSYACTKRFNQAIEGAVLFSSITS